MDSPTGAPTAAAYATDESRRFRIWRRHRKLILFSVLAVAGLALAMSIAAEKKYESTASLLFRDEALDQTLFGSSFLNPSSDPAREAATNVKLVSLEGVARRTAASLQSPAYKSRVTALLDGRPPLTSAVIETRVRVEPEGQSDVVSVTYSDNSPRLAALVANIFANEYVAFRREADRNKVDEAQALIRRQLAQLTPAERVGRQGRSLRERGDQLAILKSLQTGNAEVVQPASVPTVAASPKPIRNVFLGLVLGLMLGFGLAWLIERLDRRMRDPKDLEELFGRPIMGVIPAQRRRRGAARLTPMEAESYRLLRANMRYFDVNRDIRSVLITSAAPGEGKTTVSANLAAVAAEAGSHVLLIETDLRRPTLAGRLGIPRAPGLTTVLALGTPFEEAVQTVQVAGITGAGGTTRTLDVLTSGPLPPNPTDLIESDRMREVLDTAAQKYDLVVVDTPPTSVVSDAIPLTKVVDGVIVVARLNMTNSDAIARLRDQLRNLGAPVMGVVANGMRDATERYGYYGYSNDEYAIKADHDDFAAELLTSSKSENGGPVPEPEPAGSRRRGLRGRR